MDVFSGKQLAHLLRKREMKVSGLYREMILRGWDKSPPTMYRWVTGKSLPNANELALLGHILRCKKDDFYEDEGRVN